MAKVLALAVFSFLLITACGESKTEIDLEDISVCLNADNDPYEFELTSDQLAGDADVFLSYPAVSHFAKDADLRVGIDRLPGRVIAHMAETVEFVFGKKDADGNYIDAQMLYPEDFDITDLHDDKDNIAACRFWNHGRQDKYGPRFEDCRQVN